MNTPHPLDEATDDLSGTVRRLMIRAFKADNVIDANERVALDAYDETTGVIISYRRREVASDRFKRNGDSRVTRDAFRDAGYGMFDLDAERAVRNAHTKIVPLFPDHKDAS